jgi:hypothetical protein
MTIASTSRMSQFGDTLVKKWDNMPSHIHYNNLTHDLFKNIVNLTMVGFAIIILNIFILAYFIHVYFSHHLILHNWF